MEPLFSHLQSTSAGPATPVMSPGYPNTVTVGFMAPAEHRPFLLSVRPGPSYLEFETVY